MNRGFDSSRRRLIVLPAVAMACGLLRVTLTEGHEGHGASAHAGHGVEGAPAGGPGNYRRSLRTYSVPDVTLVDRFAQPVRLRDALAGEDTLLLNFIFTTCTAICPVMTSVFAQTPRELGADGARLRMVSISIDPENDTPPQLSAYAAKYGAGSEWRFLTGNLERIIEVQRAFDSYRGDKMSHEPLTLLRSRPGARWVRIDGFASPADLAREIRDARHAPGTA